jgi:GntR family histidine utilization transcriptional repressor
LHRRARRGARADTARLDGAIAAPLLDITCRHWAAEQPFCLEERLINLAVAPDAATEAFIDIPPGPWLLARAPWTTAEHRMRARAADPRRAALLAVAEGSPCLTVERRTWSGEIAITHVRFTYPGEEHELVARFSPSQR